MAKQDVLDAINATIVENNQKGITAQALNNVLTLMAENAGEGGSGEGALKILVPDPLSMETFFNCPTEFTQALVDEFLADMESSDAEFAATLRPLYNKIFTHNANVYNTLLEKAENKEGTLVLLDCSELMSVIYADLTGGLMPDPSLLTITSSVSEPAVVMAVDVIYSGESIERVITVAVLEKSDPLASILGNVVNFDLNSSGEITFHYAADMVPYIPEADSYTLSAEQLAVNAAIYSATSIINGTSSWLNLKFIKLVNTDTDSPFLYASVISFNRTEHSITYLQDLTLKKAVLASDGSVTVTTLGTI